jgi:hypothetical protein
MLEKLKKTSQYENNDTDNKNTLNFVSFFKCFEFVPVVWFLQQSRNLLKVLSNENRGGWRVVSIDPLQ